MFRPWIWLTLITLLAPCWAGPPGVVDPLEIRQDGDQAWVQERELVFYAEDLESGERYAFQSDRIGERHAPWSTFKIPNLLIALETGVAQGLDHPLPFDPARHPPQADWPEGWAQDQTLASAFQRSAVWAFQDLAQEIETEVYHGYLGHFGYGQGRPSLGQNRFWLDGTVTISPKEQVAFLRRLLIGQLEIGPRQIALLREVARLEPRETSVLYGKTGSGPRANGPSSGPFEGWLVGWLERQQGKPVVFATWVAAPSFAQLSTFRREASERLLKRIPSRATSTKP